MFGNVLEFKALPKQQQTPFISLASKKRRRIFIAVYHYVTGG